MEADVADILARYRPSERDWLTLDIGYEGNGCAQFSTSPGTLRGPTSVRYAESGALDRFTMTVEELKSETTSLRGSPDALFVFLYGKKDPDDPTRTYFGPWSNRCEAVEVEGSEFFLRAAQNREVLSSAGNDTVDFRPYRTIAEYKPELEPEWWAVPLVNFVSQVYIAIPELQHHPLRTRMTAELETTGEAAFYHELGYQQGNSLIPFMCEGELGFIEPLSDYADRSARVRNRETVVTAVMVGRVRDGFNAAEEDEWFPSDMITLLGLATGRPVGAPFVELRGSSGELVRRMHTQIGSPSGQHRSALIEESYNRSTGALLSSFLASEHRGEIWLRVALKHLLSAFTENGSVEERLAHLFRAAEGLSSGLKLNASRPLEVSPSVRIEVASALDTCRATLDEIARSSPADMDRLSGVMSRIRDLEGNKPGFRTQLMDLLDHAGLPDTEWLRDFKFRAQIGRSPRAWSAAAQDYRNSIFHTGFIDVRKYDIENTMPFIAHFSDVLIRVVFSLIGFNGQYVPPCGVGGAKAFERPDWPKPEILTPALLRYVA